MEDNKPKTPVEKLQNSKLVPTDGYQICTVIELMKQIILDQDKRITELELTVDTLHRQLDRK